MSEDEKVSDMVGVRENERMPIELWKNGGNGRFVVRAFNEAGHNSTDVDLLDLIDWVKKHKPELLS